MNSFSCGIISTNYSMIVCVQASRNIRWKETMSDSILKDHIQYALPNLKRFSSQSETSGKNYKKLDNYSRSFSQQTQISMLSATGLSNILLILLQTDFYFSILFHHHFEILRNVINTFPTASCLVYAGKGVDVQIMLTSVQFFRHSSRLLCS